MKNGLFRKKALDQISSPEQLNDYIRVVNPSVWFMMIGVIIFLVGVCAVSYTHLTLTTILRV